MTNLSAVRKAAEEEFQIRRWKSWAWAEKGFEKALSAILNEPDLPERCGTVIWHTHTKRVYRLDLPPELGGFHVALKIAAPKHKRDRILPRLSQAAREMINFRLFKHLGIPVVRLLAGGDERHGIFLQKSRIVSLFAEEYRSGLDLMPSPDGSKPQTPSLPQTRRDFLAFNIPLIAHLHEAGCFHSAFRPYNILMKHLPDGKLDCLWLDVATCSFRNRPAFLQKRCRLTDLRGFFKCMVPTEEEAHFSAALYKKEYPACALSGEELFQAAFR